MSDIKLIRDEVLLAAHSLYPTKPLSESLAWIGLDFLSYEANEACLAWVMARSFLRTPWEAFVAWVRVA